MLRPLISVTSLGIFISLTLACGGATEGQESTPEGTTTTTPPSTSAITVAVAGASLGSGTANVQLAFDASAVTSAATVSVRKVVLYEVQNETRSETLTASSPTVWNGGGYESWNESVPPGGDLRASYQLTPPTYGAGDQRGTMDAYSTRYKLRITLDVGGITVTVESRELQREPEFAT